MCDAWRSYAGGSYTGWSAYAKSVDYRKQREASYPSITLTYPCLVAPYQAEHLQSPAAHCTLEHLRMLAMSKSQELIYIPG